MKERQRVICLAGPTGVGKTAAALGLAAALDGEVINSDSRQVYRDFPRITAQPSEEERAACRHHLYGFLACETRLSAGRWVDMAWKTVQEVAGRGKTPILVGGTGLYFRALLDGIADIPPVDAEVSALWLARCAAEGPKALHAHLHTVDPAYAARIHPHDRQRVVRALEVWQSTGRTITWWHAHAAPVPRCEALYLGLETTLASLEPRLAVRMDAMLEAGALDEARAAWVRCADPHAPGWSGIGCTELWQHLAGECGLEEARALWLRHTKAYAKRQLTWFRAEARVRWFPPDAMDALCAAAYMFVHKRVYGQALKRHFIHTTGL